jgi:hypothetical protein
MIKRQKFINIGGDFNTQYNIDSYNTYIVKEGVSACLDTENPFMVCFNGNDYERFPTYKAALKFAFDKCKQEYYAYQRSLTA